MEGITDDQETKGETVGAEEPMKEDTPTETTELNTELEKYWKAVRDNPTDFTGWTYLLQYVEQENKIEAAREAYDAFFGHYPYCYGYWKKYADMEKRHGNLEKATEVFDKGVVAIPLSIELWLHYINFYIGEYTSTEQGESDIRKLYERALSSAGHDFRSDKLWDSYISWEKDLVRVTELYHRLLAIPTQLYSHHFDNFKQHVYMHNPKEILSLDDFLKMRQDVVAKSTTPDEEDEDAVPSGDVAPPGEEDVPPGMETDGKGNEAEINKIKERIIQIQEETFKKTEEEVSKRWNYEEAIKRPYFHVKPLERSQLKNWREYLDYEMQNGDYKRVVTLFERCMIASALYEDFWMKYAKYMEDHGAEGVRSVYTRACKIHLPKKPYIHLAWAAFEERQGNHSGAWEILANLDKVVPGLVMVSMRRISLERRTGSKEDAEALFRDYIENASQPEIGSYFSIKYARYLFKICGEREQARKVLTDAIEKDKGNLKLYLQLIDLEYQNYPVEEDKIIDVFSLILECENFPLETKVKMSQRKLEFLEDFGGTIGKLKEAYDEHQKLMKDLHVERKKRPHETSGHSHEEPSEKRSKPDSVQNGAGDMSGAHDSSHNYPYNHWGGYQNSGYNYGPQWGGHYGGGYHHGNYHHQS
ncbi:pre-mRNA-processing factor 39-like isoform X1 [Argopecten irradians]|uniref:pre-mRNA-processing factor 39-like isoform X1 n=1 Tax=Argopecten irradians TaxID=31199 RepID=UPI0037222F87